MFSPLLYQLSYLAVCEPRIRHSPGVVVNYGLEINDLRVHVGDSGGISQTGHSTGRGFRAAAPPTRDASATEPIGSPDLSPATPPSGYPASPLLLQGSSRSRCTSDTHRTPRNACRQTSPAEPHDPPFARRTSDTWAPPTRSVRATHVERL